MAFLDDSFLFNLFDFNDNDKLDFDEKIIRDTFLVEQFENETTLSSDFVSLDGVGEEITSLHQKMIDLGFSESYLINIKFDLMDSDEQEEFVLKAELGLLDDESIAFESTDSTTLEITTNTAYEKLDRVNYSTKRMYDAACLLHQLNNDVRYFTNENSKNIEKEKCMLILKSDCVAAKYLTVYDGFIYAQAVKENFDLPVKVSDEDDESKTYFPNLFMQIVKKNLALAIDIWAWIIKEFGPYKKFMRQEDVIYGFIFVPLDEYPKEFLETLVKKLGEDKDFRRGLLTNSPELSCYAYLLVSKALKIGEVVTAQNIFIATVENKKSNGKNIKDFIMRTIEECKDYEGLETMECFKDNILPLVLATNDNRIKRLASQIEEEICSYINYIESTNEKYQYSRKNAWRSTYKNMPDCLIDPLEFNTEEEYIKAIKRAKQSAKRIKARELKSDNQQNGVDSSKENKPLIKNKTPKNKKKENKLLSSELQLQKLIARVLCGEEWDDESNVSLPESIRFTFVYPNGKAGDINMAIVEEIGIVQQTGEIEYTATIPTTEKERIVLLLSSYSVKWPDFARQQPRTEIEEFLYHCNLYHRLRQECDDFMYAGPNRQYHPLRNQGRELAQKYIESIRQKRNQVYSELVVKGEASRKWVSEQKAYNIIKSIYLDAIYQYHSNWLGEQSIDIYIPSKKIGIEYQGAQHYKAVEIFGGEEGLAATIKRDELKKQKCLENGVKLVEWRYDEPLTVEYIQKKIKE